MNSVTPERSIAVLPLVNLSADPENEYFSDGMTEEIINALTKVQGLKVTARTSSFAYKSKSHDIREIGKTLGVNSVLEGSVRKAGERLRISVQLVQAKDGFHLWSERFDRKLEDIFALQDEISLLVVDKIRENFGHLEMQDTLVDQATSNLTAYDHFLKGRSLMLRWTLPDIEQAIHFFKAAIAEDPKFARAYYEIVWCYYMLGTWAFYPIKEADAEAKKYFDQAIEIDRELPEYHFCLATRSFWVRWDFKEAYRHLKNTLAVNPGYTIALENMAELMLATGHFEQGLDYVEQCLDIDPLSANHHYTKAHLLYFRGDFAEAISYFDKALEINPDFELAQGQKALCLIKQGDYAGLTNYIAAGGTNKALVLYNLLHRDTLDFPESLLDNLKVPTLVPFSFFILANSNRREEARDLLLDYIDQALGQIINFRYDPMLKALRDFPEIQAYLDHGFAPEQNEPALEQMPIDTQGAELELEGLMMEEQLYLQQDLNLRSLAEKMEMHPNKLSWLINEAIGKNFNEYINGMRLETFKQKALDPANSHITLLGLAYESGFNSKSVFNDFFKKSTGMTPRAWVKSKAMEEG